jgi:hypothetical protein
MKQLPELDQLTFYFNPRYQRNLKADVIEALNAKKNIIEPLVDQGILKKLFPVGRNVQIKNSLSSA